MDKATKHSLEFIQAVQDSLHIELDEGRASVDPASVNEFSIGMFANAARDLYDRNVILDAISGIEGYGGVQTTAVGWAGDFDTFIKVGMLIGQRVVLWEVRLISILRRQSFINVNELLTAACDVVELKPLVEEGGAVLLPHPSTWLGRYQHWMERLAQVRPSNELAGLLNARALLDEGFKVHPYSWQPNARTLAKLAAGVDMQISDRDNAKHELTYALQDMILHTEAAFLQNVSLCSFYKITRDEKLMKELAERLLVTPAHPFEDDTKSQEESIKAIQDLVDELVRGFASQRDRVIKKQKRLSLARAGTAAGGLGLVRDFLAVITTSASAISFLALLGSAVGAGLGVKAMLEEIWARPNNPVIYQVFGQLEAAEEEERHAAISKEYGL